MSLWQLTAHDGDELVAHEPRMAPLIAHFGLLTRECYDDSFTGLAAIILSQQLSDCVFAQCWAHINPRARSEPQVLKELIERGDYLPCTQGKRQALLNVATRFVSGELSHQGLLALGKEERHALLGRIKGIGPWSCAMFDLMVARERDCLLTGDLGVMRGLKLTLGLDLKALPLKARRLKEEELKAHFSPVGSIATFYLWAASAARFSPLNQESSDTGWAQVHSER